MGKFKLIKQLRKIERECDKNPQLEKALEPFVKQYIENKDLNEYHANLFIKEYHRIKKELRI